MAKAPTTTPAPAPQAESTTTIGGHVIQIMGFLVDNKADIRQQARMLELMADVKEGKRPISDLTPYLKSIELKMTWTRKRFTPTEAAALHGTAAAKAVEAETEDQGDDDDKGDFGHITTEYNSSTDGED